jgi:hypothetical protein
MEEWERRAKITDVEFLFFTLVEGLWITNLNRFQKTQDPVYKIMCFMKLRIDFNATIEIVTPTLICFIGQLYG